MPPATRFQSFLVVFTLLCLAAIALVILDEFTGYEWVRRVVSIGQNLSNLFFTAVALTFIAVEGGPLMLAAWLKKAQIKEAEEKGIATGRAEERAIIFEAFRNMQPGEDLADAVARLEKEKARQDDSKG